MKHVLSLKYWFSSQLNMTFNCFGLNINLEPRSFRCLWTSTAGSYDIKVAHDVREAPMRNSWKACLKSEGAYAPPGSSEPLAECYIELQSMYEARQGCQVDKNCAPNVAFSIRLNLQEPKSSASFSSSYTRAAKHYTVLGLCEQLNPLIIDSLDQIVYSSYGGTSHLYNLRHVLSLHKSTESFILALPSIPFLGKSCSYNLTSDPRNGIETRVRTRACDIASNVNGCSTP